MRDFGYYMRTARQFWKEQRQAEALTPKEYGMMLQKKKKKEKTR